MSDDDEAAHRARIADLFARAERELAEMGIDPATATPAELKIAILQRQHAWYMAEAHMIERLLNDLGAAPA